MYCVYFVAIINQNKLIMALFSQRIGITPIRTILQIDSLDENLRNGIWNLIFDTYLSNMRTSIERIDRNKMIIHQQIWCGFYKDRLDEMPHFASDYYKTIKRKFYSSEWYEVYDLVQFLVETDLKYDSDIHIDFIEGCNIIFERELSGYRFISNQLAPICSEIDIKSIEDILNNEDIFYSVKSQIKRALELFSDRVKPDYRNSIKESISAVEGYCKIITGEPNATLSKALQKIEKTHPIHPSLKSAFDKLYAYTSDESGIRHAMLDDGKEIAQEDALFMLIACSAFINYLQQKAAKL